ncbi:hypothetical protein [Planomonospora sphaerica]|uniref:hypothetical protein n=1 Tax=Planomonospora sphaerica TaxID=161355 RepID=UPI00083B6F4B|nr:hypothetical protein [Planomonospora sphaerica]
MQAALEAWLVRRAIPDPDRGGNHGRRRALFATRTGRRLSARSAAGMLDLLAARALLTCEGPLADRR